MRKILCAVMLCLCLGTGLSAAELTAAQIQSIYAAAKSGNKEVTLKIDDKDVVFTLNMDPTGNIFAEPKAGADKTSLGILGIRIAVTINADGSRTPKSVTAVSTNKAVNKFDVQVNADGSIATLLQSSSFTATSTEEVPAPKLVGGIGKNSTTGVGGTSTPLPGAIEFSVKVPTPAGTSPSDGAPAGSFYQNYSNMLP